MDRSSKDERREQLLKVMQKEIVTPVEKTKGIVRIKELLELALLAICTILLFFTNASIQPDARTKVFLVILTTLAGSICILGKKFLQKYKDRSGIVGILLISVYASLTSFGQRFFLNGNTRVHLSLEGAVYCAIGTLWFVPVICSLLAVTEKLISCPGKQRVISKSRAKWIMYVCLAVCQLIAIYITWPGGYPNDAIVQLRQAVGIDGLNDWHPVIHTMLERAVFAVFKNAGAIVAVQMLVFSWLLGAILMMGYEYGKIPFPFLIAIGCTFEILPNQVLTGCNLLKDYPFSLALLWCGYLMANLVLDTPWTKKLSYYICVCLGLFLTMTLRHNGIVPGIFIIAGCIIITVRAYARFKLRLVAAVAAALCFFGIYKGPVMKALNVIPNSVSPYTTMLCAVGSCINKDLPLSEEANEIMKQVIPLDDWRDYYSRFLGHDIYQWGRPEGSVPYDTSGVTAKKAFRVYLEALIKYPDVIIKDRLDGCDIMWDVAQPSDSFSAKTFFFMEPNVEQVPVDTTGWTQLEDGRWFKYTKLATAYSNSTTTQINDFLDVLLWRTGAYLIALFTLFLFWGKNHDGRFVYAALPMLGNIAASLLVVFHQSFRYVWFIQPNVLMLIYLTIVFGKTVSKEERK